MSAASLESNSCKWSPRCSILMDAKIATTRPPERSRRCQAATVEFTSPFRTHIVSRGAQLGCKVMGRVQNCFTRVARHPAHFSAKDLTGNRASVARVSRFAIVHYTCNPIFTAGRSASCSAVAAPRLRRQLSAVGRVLAAAIVCGIDSSQSEGSHRPPSRDPKRNPICAVRVGAEAPSPS